MKRKLLILFFAAVMMFTLAACENSKKQPDRSVAIQAITEYVAPTLEGYEIYGAKEFKVVIPSLNEYDIVCPKYQHLRDKDKYDLLMDLRVLDNVEDPKSEGEFIEFSGHIYIDIQQEKYYYYINKYQAEFSERPSAGLYYNKAPRECVYEES